MSSISGLTRDGTAEPVARGESKFSVSGANGVQLTTSRIGQSLPRLLMPCLLNVTDHTIPTTSII